MQKFLRSFTYAWQGIVYAVGTQLNMRVHLTVSLAAIALSLWLGISRLEWMLLLITLAQVLSLEIINTALEVSLDFICKEHNPAIGHAKDLAAGAVLISALFAIGVGVLLWGPRLWHLVSA